MPLPLIFGLILLGLVAGVFSGVVGIGGGIILIPALVYFFGLSQHEAQGTSLGMLMLPVGFLAVIQYYKQGFVDYKLVLFIAIGFVLGGFIGGRLAVTLPETLVKRVFALFMIAVAVKMLFFDKS
ncbi:sulfite exporter TauE/SafE family protein [Chitinophaga barathri]|uniref:Probable membrane transporter protein n=1 Tax=Chitinophaga barathri TaxID=1647451 RepID=A0A3N4MMH0_9BACT|nr:sulfite exporter TauE/SafE family protein [Chitinophaga barathri]RPD43256.1 sulfite exporter TauE/SafE family protein [Chitinophaga barathri]